MLQPSRSRNWCNPSVKRWRTRDFACLTAQFGLSSLWTSSGPRRSHILRRTDCRAPPRFWCQRGHCRLRERFPSGRRSPGAGRQSSRAPLEPASPLADPLLLSVASRVGVNFGADAGRLGALRVGAAPLRRRPDGPRFDYGLVLPMPPPSYSCLGGPTRLGALAAWRRGCRWPWCLTARCCPGAASIPVYLGSRCHVRFVPRRGTNCRWPWVPTRCLSRS